MRSLLLPLALVGALLVWCGGPTPDAPAAPTVPAAASPAADPGPDSMICHAASGVYLFLHSAAWHDYDLCTGDAPFTGTIDDLLNIPGMDRRCFIQDAVKTSGAVYSARGKALIAARAYCAVHGGTDS